MSEKAKSFYLWPPIQEDEGLDFSELNLPERKARKPRKGKAVKQLEMFSRKGVQDE